ncbi:MAG: hypothetical protein QNK42_10310 [Pseudodonghicola sp.]|nr:hypothetical protein [Pseudodonghicola sp.]
MTARDDGAEPEQKAPSVFLERQSYRRRRLTDAARLLPALGILLYAVPLLWPAADDTGGAEPMPTSGAILYIFLVWALLILANVWFGFLTRSLSGAMFGTTSGAASVPASMAAQGEETAGGAKRGQG